MKDIQDAIISQLTGTEVASLATEEANVPWVRYMNIRTSSDLIIRCATGLNSRKVSAINNNPKVHLCCGHSELVRSNPFLQIQALAAVVNTKKERQAFWRKSMESIFEGPDDPNYAIIVILPVRIELWALQHKMPFTWKVPDGDEMDPYVWKVHDAIEVASFLKGTHPVFN